MQKRSEIFQAVKKRIGALQEKEKDQLCQTEVALLNKN